MSKLDYCFEPYKIPNVHAAKKILCDEDRATARLYDFVGITFFSHVILRRHDCFD